MKKGSITFLPPKGTKNQQAVTKSYDEVTTKFTNPGSNPPVEIPKAKQATDDDLRKAAITEYYAEKGQQIT